MILNYLQVNNLCLNLSNYTIRALIGAVIATIFTGIGAFALDNLSGYEVFS